MLCRNRWNFQSKIIVVTSEWILSYITIRLIVIKQKNCNFMFLWKFQSIENSIFHHTYITIFFLTILQWWDEVMDIFNVVRFSIWTIIQCCSLVYGFPFIFVVVNCFFQAKFIKTSTQIFRMHFFIIYLTFKFFQNYWLIK